MFHEFNDIGHTSDSCWFSPFIGDFPLHKHICIQLQNKKRSREHNDYNSIVNCFLGLQWKSKWVHVETLSTFTVDPQTGRTLLTRKTAGVKSWLDISWTRFTEQGCVRLRMELGMTFISNLVPDLNWIWIVAKGCRNLFSNLNVRN